MVNDTEQDHRPPEPTWADYLADRWTPLPVWAKVFLALFGGCLVLTALIGTTVWLFANGWTIAGSIAGCASVAAGVTMLAALVTEGFDL